MRFAPEALRTDETLQLKYVLTFKTMDDLVQALIERRVHRLSYEGLRKLDSFLQKTFDVSLFIDPDQKKRTV